jgi:uncharacterized membrane-anchored protein
MKKITSLMGLIVFSTCALAQEAPTTTAEAPTEQKALNPEEQAAADKLAAAMQEYEKGAKKILESLKYQTGAIELPGGKAGLNLPEGFRYLNPKDTAKVLCDLWGNPPSSSNDTLGMVVPPNTDLMGDESWAIIVSYEDDGYVSDEDADKIKYDDLLDEMKAASASASEERINAGYGKMLLTNWALPPHYDKSAKVLHWAKSFETDRQEKSMNYDMRVLGREGVLSLNAVALASQAKMIESMSPQLIGLAHFKPGHTYADYDPAKDRKANYSLAGLILGGAVGAKVLAKGGFLVLLAKFGKLLIIPAIFLIGLVKRFFARKTA